MHLSPLLLQVLKRVAGKLWVATCLRGLPLAVRATRKLCTFAFVKFYWQNGHKLARHGDWVVRRLKC